jgi:predicted phage terminase large subunit-like protein
MKDKRRHYTIRETEEVKHLARLRSDFKYFFAHIVIKALLGDDALETYKFCKAFELQADYVVSILTGDTKRLSVEIAPRNSKSLVWSVAMPMWEWLTNPSHKFISVSHHDDVLKQFHSDRKLVFKHPDYQRIVEWTMETNTTDTFRNSKGGHIISMVMGYVTTGLGGETIIVDDPIAAKDKDNPAILKKVWKLFTGTLMSRLNDKKNGNIVVVSQRLAEGDVSDNVVRVGYQQLKIQSIQMEEQTFKFPISGEVWVRPAGDVMNPDYEPLEVLTELKKLDPDNFNAQYQQEPPVDGDGTIEFGRVKKYRAVRESYQKIVLSADTASSVKEKAANWGLTVWGIYQEGGLTCFDLLYAHAKKYEYPEGKKKVFDIIEAYNVNEIVIENKSTGVALIPELKRLSLRVIAIVPTKDKVSRALSVAHVFNNGQVRIPDILVLPFTEGWLSNWSREIKGFPVVSQRDLLDSTSQILSHIGGVKTNLLSFYKLNRA